METLPLEVFDAVILDYVHTEHSRNAVLNSRLVCRAFDQSLRPHVARALKLDISRLMMLNRQPGCLGLQAIADVVRVLHIDLAVVRDQEEIDFFRKRAMVQPDFLSSFESRFTMGPRTFTEDQLIRAFKEVTLTCNSVHTMRVTLPRALLWENSTDLIILENTLKVLAEGSPLDGEQSNQDDNLLPPPRLPLLSTLVVDNMLPSNMASIWNTTAGVASWKAACQTLGHLTLKINLRQHSDSLDPARRWFGYAFWCMISYASKLETLCVRGDPCAGGPYFGKRHVRAESKQRWRWELDRMPCPTPGTMRTHPLRNLTCLELRDMYVKANALLTLCAEVSGTLEELFLANMRLKIVQTTAINSTATDELWVGLPGRRPPEGAIWLAAAVRCSLPRLKLCRAADFDYDHWTGEDITDANVPFDYQDPCGLDRTIAQRFAEIVMGIRQPPLRPGEVQITDVNVDTATTGDALSATYFPASPDDDERVVGTIDRKDLRIEDWNTEAYQSMVCNPTSSWSSSSDGFFPDKVSHEADLQACAVHFKQGFKARYGEIWEE